MCQYCNSADVDYACPNCGAETCYKHTGSTDEYFCKKHPKIKLNRIQAETRQERCQVQEHSRCPTCSSLLEYSTLPSGQMFLKCSKCSWNSRTNSPIILGNSEKEIEREAQKHGLAYHPDKCNTKLKRIRGKDFCMVCFLNQIMNHTETPFRALQLLSLVPLTAGKRSVIEQCGS